jgi:hypothetical protein
MKVCALAHSASPAELMVDNPIETCAAVDGGRD